MGFCQPSVNPADTSDSHSWNRCTLSGTQFNSRVVRSNGGWCRHCPNKRMSGSLTGDVLLPRFNCGFTSRVAAAGHRRGGSCLHLHRLVHSPEPGRLAHQKGFQLEFSSLYSALKYSIPKPRTSSLLSVFRSCRPNPVSISRKKL